MVVGRVVGGGGGGMDFVWVWVRGDGVAVLLAYVHL